MELAGGQGRDGAFDKGGQQPRSLDRRRIVVAIFGRAGQDGLVVADNLSREARPASRVLCFGGHDLRPPAGRKTIHQIVNLAFRPRHSTRPQLHGLGEHALTHEVEEAATLVGDAV